MISSGCYFYLSTRSSRQFTDTQAHMHAHTHMCICNHTLASPYTPTLPVGHCIGRVHGLYMCKLVPGSPRVLKLWLSIYSSMLSVSVMFGRFIGCAYCLAQCLVLWPFHTCHVACQSTCHIACLYTCHVVCTPVTLPDCTCHVAHLYTCRVGCIQVM